MRTKLLASSLLIAGLVVSAAGCSGPAGDTPAGSINVITQVAGQLEAAGIQVDPGSLACAGDLAAKSGEKVSCDFAADNQPVELVASVVKVNGSDVDVKIETRARPVPKANLAYVVGERIEREMNDNLDATVCDGDLAAETGASTTCTLTSGKTTRKVTVAVSSLNGGLVEFSIADA